MRRPAPSFVFTVSAVVLACHREPQKEAIGPEPSVATTTASASSTASAPPVVASASTSETPETPKAAKATRKRKRTAKASTPKWAKTSMPWADVVGQNPTDAEGRTIFVGGDDTCYVTMPAKKPHNLPPGFPDLDTVDVDCPPELDDPAWDDCTGGTLQASTKKNECWCAQSYGNPPPPPAVVHCPKTKKS